MHSEIMTFALLLVASLALAGLSARANHPQAKPLNSMDAEEPNLTTTHDARRGCQTYRWGILLLLVIAVHALGRASTLRSPGVMLGFVALLPKRRRPKGEQEADREEAEKLLPSGGCQEMLSPAQLRKDNMRRRKFQKGSVKEKTIGGRKVWYAQWWETTENKRSKILGECNGADYITLGQAELRLADIFRPLNVAMTISSRPIHRFGDFVAEVYLPFCRRTWKASTDATTTQVIKTHLLPEFGPSLLQAITRETMQDFLELKARTLSLSVVKHLRWDLHGIFKLAVSDGLLAFNPAGALRNPRFCQPGRSVQSLDIDEVLLYFSVLPFREQLIARLAIFVGMRPDEILALRWKDIADRAAIVDERVYRGVLDTPKNGKTREVGLGSLLADDLCKWFDAAIDQTPEAFVFPSEHGTPMSRDNVWRRYMWPHLKAVGLQRATFQVLRKTNGTIMKDLGIDQKVAADLRGHGLGVSMELYVLSRRKLKVDAVEEMESAVTLNQKLKSA